MRIPRRRWARDCNCDVANDVGGRPSEWRCVVGGRCGRGIMPRYAAAAGRWRHGRLSPLVDRIMLTDRRRPSLTDPSHRSSRSHPFTRRRGCCCSCSQYRCCAANAFIFVVLWRSRCLPLSAAWYVTSRYDVDVAACGMINVFLQQRHLVDGPSCQSIESSVIDEGGKSFERRFEDLLQRLDTVELKHGFQPDVTYATRNNATKVLAYNWTPAHCVRCVKCNATDASVNAQDFRQTDTPV